MTEPGRVGSGRVRVCVGRVRSRKSDLRPTLGQLRDAKNFAKHLKAHERYSGRTIAKVRLQKKSSRTPIVTRAAFSSSQLYISHQNWKVPWAARWIYPYLCIDAHISTLRRVAGRGMLTLPIMTADAVTTDGQAIIKELKQQFGGVSSQVISEAAKKGNCPPYRAPEPGNPTTVSTIPSINEVVPTSGPTVTLIAIDYV